MANKATHFSGPLVSANGFQGVHNGSVVIPVGGTVTGDVGTGSTASGAVTVSKMAGVITTEALTTAAGSAFVITLTNTVIAVGDIILITRAGGTNTRHNFQIDAVAAAGSATITVYNTEPTNALNGTIIFNFVVIKH